MTVLAAVGRTNRLRFLCSPLHLQPMSAHSSETSGKHEEYGGCGMGG